MKKNIGRKEQNVIQEGQVKNRFLITYSYTIFHQDFRYNINRALKI